MKKLIQVLLLLFVVSSFSYAQENEGQDIPRDLEEGKTLFTSNCAACHLLGKGKLVGPDLMGVSERLEEDWIINFVQSSSTMIADGDEYANKIFNEYDKMIMIDHAHLTDDNVRNIIAYIGEKTQEIRDKEEEEAKKKEEEDKEEVPLPVNPEELAMAKMVFWGSIALLSLLFVVFAVSRIKIKKY